MSDTQNTQFSHDSFPRRFVPSELATTLRSVGQDKPHSQRARIASAQPAPPENVMRPHPTNKNSSRSQNTPIPKRKTAHLTLWVKPIVKAELQRLAHSEGVSISKVGAAFLERAMQAHIDMQYSALFQPIIESTIRTELKRYFSRTVLFLARITMTLDVMKGLVKWLCRRIAGATNDQIDAVEVRSRTDARVNLVKRTPQLEAISHELEQTLMEGIV
jgi:hypothetical protein